MLQDIRPIHANKVAQYIFLPSVFHTFVISIQKKLFPFYPSSNERRYIEIKFTAVHILLGQKYINE